MAKNPKPPPVTLPVENATTVGQGDAETIDSPKLIALTVVVVLTPGANGIEHARLFRNSIDAPDAFSCEHYDRRAGGAWRGRVKEPDKYDHPKIPPTACPTMIDGVPFYTLRPMTDAEKAEHQMNLCRLLLRP